MDVVTQLKIIGEIAFAMLLGGIIGIEREISKKPAGLRTMMLVSGSAAVLMITGELILRMQIIKENANLISLDPIRIIQAIITGISFLGAGTIIRRKEGEHVEGLTTAAAILLAGIVGICVGLEQYILATGISVLGLFVISGLRFIDKWVFTKKKAK